jgi:hypothetical protein
MSNHVILLVGGICLCVHPHTIVRPQLPRVSVSCRLTIEEEMFILEMFRKESNFLLNRFRHIHAMANGHTAMRACVRSPKLVSLQYGSVKDNTCVENPKEILSKLNRTSYIRPTQVCVVRRCV